MPLCPTCHSEIGNNSTTPSGREQGAEGTDADGNPIPRWSDDPLLTPAALNGSLYQGFDRIRGRHIKELQEKRKQQETEIGISPPTEFSDIDEDSHVTRRHIIELRESTEKLLNAAGLTLEDYFKQNEAGDELPQNPALEQRGADDPQTEWIDVERGAPYVNTTGGTVTTFVLPDATVVPSPTLPKRTKIRAVHIEDLRHPLNLFTVPALVVEVQGFQDTYKGVKEGAHGKEANFKNLEPC